MDGPVLIGAILAFPGSVWVTARATRALFSWDGSEAKSPVPSWLEALLPLRGRWLTYLCWGPVYLPMILALFASQMLIGTLLVVWVIRSVPLVP
jgi:hypothetical protein